MGKHQQISYKAIANFVLLVCVCAAIAEGCHMSSVGRGVQILLLGVVLKFFISMFGTIAKNLGTIAKNLGTIAKNLGTIAKNLGTIAKSINYIKTQTDSVVEFLAQNNKDEQEENSEDEQEENSEDEQEENSEDEQEENSEDEQEENIEEESK